MALSENQAEVLGALAQGEPMTTRELSRRTGLAATTARTAATSLTHDGWISSTDRVPTYWQITAYGLRLVATRRYREYRAGQRLSAAPHVEFASAVSGLPRGGRP
ncbi:helix-turn-helix domain-containing protein [Nocardia sp. NBC_00881]|uniref:helix-turn-helix domain-containing protein n=1 Tax=Nocardia sp. NBC_00881 TaxID=2975995 RepID=UPI003869E42E|nr:helix-turn-helix domain-containing protein [Nocardia sp. NBC_00881]